MKILQLTPAPQGTMLVYETGRKVPVLCLSLCVFEDGQQYILPCVMVGDTIVPYAGDSAKVVL